MTSVSRERREKRRARRQVIKAQRQERQASIPVMVVGRKDGRERDEPQSDEGESLGALAGPFSEAKTKLGDPKAEEARPLNGCQLTKDGVRSAPRLVNTATRASRPVQAWAARVCVGRGNNAERGGFHKPLVVVRTKSVGLKDKGLNISVGLGQIGSDTARPCQDKNCRRDTRPCCRQYPQFLSNFTTVRIPSIQNASTFALRIANPRGIIVTAKVFDS